MIDLQRRESTPMTSLFTKHKVGGNAWEVRAASYGHNAKAGAISASTTDKWYTIEYLSEREAGAQPVVSPMVFSDREAALSSAHALLRAGFSVSRVAGPDFEIDGTSLAGCDWKRRAI
jgi:hypothetical protein